MWKGTCVGAAAALILMHSAASAEIAFGPEISTSNGGAVTFTIPTPTTLSGDVTLTFSISGDLDSNTERVAVRADTVFLGELFDSDTSDDGFFAPSDPSAPECGPPVTRTAVIPASALADAVSDGELVLSFDPPINVDAFCGAEPAFSIRVSGVITFAEPPESDATADAADALAASRTRQTLSAVPDLANQIDGGSSATVNGAGSDGQGSFAFGGSFSQIAAAQRARRADRRGGDASDGAPLERDFAAANLAPPRVGLSGRAVNSFDGWVSARGAYFSQEDGALDGDGFAVVGQLGLDYKVHSTAVLGLFGQVDYIESDAVAGVEADGIGFLVGPYLVYRPFGTITFEALAAAGFAFNTLEESAGESEYDSRRLLLSTRLSGRYGIGVWTVEPGVRASYYGESQERFTDAGGAVVEEQTVGRGEIRFGPEIGRAFALSGGGTVSPFVRVEGIAPFGQTGAFSNGADVFSDSVSMAGALGLNASVGRAVLSAEAEYEGLFDEDYESVSGQLKLRVPFN